MATAVAMNPDKRRRVIRSALLHAALALGFFGLFFLAMS